MIRSKIKICGIKEIETLECCIENRVAFFGLIFFEKSPRYINLNDAIKLIKFSQNKDILSVGVFVDKPVDELNRILKTLKVNYIQLHGKEDNNYIKIIKKKNTINVIKVLQIDSYNDFENIKNYPNADMFLFDYKPSEKELPGGNAKKFDWNLIKNLQINKNWFLSGGINIKNVNHIKDFIIPYGIDISSGVEDQLGNKNNEKITSLIKLHESI